MNWLQVTTVALVLGATLASVTLGTAAETKDRSTYTKVGDMAPDFSFTTLDGVEVTNVSVKGKVLLLNFFATWCGPCRAELPHLEKAFKELKDDAHFAFVVAGREHTRAELEEFRATTKLALPFAPDPGRRVYSKFAEKTIPRNYVIGPDGRIVFQQIGFDNASFAELLKVVEEQLRALEKPA